MSSNDVNGFPTPDATVIPAARAVMSTMPRSKTPVPLRVNGPVTIPLCSAVIAMLCSAIVSDSIASGLQIWSKWRRQSPLKPLESLKLALEVALEEALEVALEEALEVALEVAPNGSFLTDSVKV